MPSYVSPQERSRQLVREAHQQYRSYDLLYCPRVVQPRARSVPLFPSGCLLVRCWGSWWAHRLDKGQLCHRPAWPQAGLVAGWLGHGGRSLTHRVRFHIVLPHLRQRQLVGTHFIQASSPAQFQVPSCLPLRMSVCSGASIPHGSSDPGVAQTVHRSILCGDVVCRRAQWAHAGLGCANLLCQGWHAHAASLHSKMRSRQFVGTGGSDAPQMRSGQLVGKANQQYRSYGVAGPRGAQPRARPHSFHQFACWCDCVIS